MAQVNNGNCTLVGLVESNGHAVAVPACVSKSDGRGQTTARSINPTDQPLELQAGAKIVSYTLVDNAGVKKLNIPADRRKGGPGPLVEHLAKVWEGGQARCRGRQQEEELRCLLNRYSNVFKAHDKDLGSTSLVEHQILVIKDTCPYNKFPTNWDQRKRRKQSSWRFCVDYRKLNNVTRHAAFPISRIDDSLDALAGSQYFNTLDLTSAYWQVFLDKDARKKLAFVTQFGLWQWKVLPFGLTSAPATF